MKKIVIIAFLLFALLLTACGGKGNTGVSQAASGAAQPGDNSPSPVEPAGPAARPDDSLYYLATFDEKNMPGGEGSGLYYLPNPEADPILVSTEKGENESLNPWGVGLMTYTYGRKVVTYSADFSTVCIASGYTQLRGWETAESKYDAWGNGDTAVKQMVEYGDDYSLNLYRGGTLRRALARHTAAHAISPDGALLYYVTRDAADLNKGKLTLFSYEADSGTTRLLDEDVTDWLVCFANGTLAWTRSDGSLCLLRDGKPEAVAELTEVRKAWTQGLQQADTGYDHEPPVSVTQAMVLEKGGQLSLLSQSGTVRRLDSDVTESVALFADGSAYWLQGSRLRYWNGAEVSTVMLDAKKLTLKGAGWQKPLLIYKDEDALVLVQGDGSRRLEISGLIWAGPDPAEETLYYTVKAADGDSNTCDLYAMALDAREEPRLYAAGIAANAKSIFFLDGAPCYFRDLEQVMGRGTLERAGDLVGSLYCGQTRISDSACLDVGLRDTTLCKNNSGAQQSPLFYYETRETARYEYETRVLRYEAGESQPIAQEEMRLLAQSGGKGFLMHAVFDEDRGEYVRKLYLDTNGRLRLLGEDLCAISLEKYQ